MPPSSSSRCTGAGGFPCNTRIVCQWITLQATGPAGDPAPEVPFSGMVVLEGNGGVASIDSPFYIINGSVTFDLQGNGWTMDSGGGGLIWTTSGAGWTLDTGGGGISWKTGGGGFDIDTEGGTWSFAGDGSVDGSLEVDLPAGGSLLVRDSSNAPIFEVRDDGSVHILTGTAVVADL